MGLSGLILLFIALPFVELAILLRVDQAIGLFYTLALVVLTGVLGAALARSQGFRVLAEIQREMSLGRLPGPQILDGVMILVAGVLLITPGLITDSIGFLLLVPGVRVVIRAGLRRGLERKLQNGTTHFTIWRG